MSLEGGSSVVHRRVQNNTDSDTGTRPIYHLTYRLLKINLTKTEERKKNCRPRVHIISDQSGCGLQAKTKMSEKHDCPIKVQR